MMIAGRLPTTSKFSVCWSAMSIFDSLVNEGEKQADEINACVEIGMELLNHPEMSSRYMALSTHSQFLVAATIVVAMCEVPVDDLVCDGHCVHVGKEHMMRACDAMFNTQMLHKIAANRSVN